MELSSLILLLLGVATTGIRLSLAARVWAVGFTVLAWAGLPWLTADLAARTSAVQIRAWVSAADHIEGFAAILMIEAILGGWAMLQYSERRVEDRDGRSILRWTAAIAPSPALLFGVGGCQVALFHKIAGQGFSTLTGVLSAILGLGLMGVVLLTRQGRPDRDHRAGLAFPLYVGLFLAGASLPPLTHRPPIPTAGGEFDVRKSVATATLAVVLVGAGLAIQQRRSLRKGVKTP